MIGHHLGDHLPDRKRLTVPPFDVAGLKPVEAAIWIIGALLLGQEQGEPEPLRQRRPSRPAIITWRVLRASVEDNHERAIG